MLMCNKTSECPTHLERFQPSAVSKVCFAVAIVAMGSHCIFVTCIRNIRMLYGSYILTNIYIMTLSYISFLISCSTKMSENSTVRYGRNDSASGVSSMDQRTVTELMSQFGFLSSIYWNLAVSCQLCLVVFRGCHTSSSFRLFDFVQYFWGALLGFLLPAALVYLKFHFDLTVSEHRRVSDAYKREIECSLTTSSYNDLFFFLPIFGGLIFSIVFLGAIAVMSNNHAREDRIFIYQNQEINARFGMSCKLTVTYCIIWSTGAAATHLSELALWHVFTLCCSLQTIFVLVNFVFSRPVLDLLYRWRLDSFWFGMRHGGGRSDDELDDEDDDCDTVAADGGCVEDNYSLRRQKPPSLPRVQFTNKSE